MNALDLTHIAYKCICGLGVRIHTMHYRLLVYTCMHFLILHS